jgi:hypothetical protein
MGHVAEGSALHCELLLCYIAYMTVSKALSKYKIYNERVFQCCITVSYLLR